MDSETVQWSSYGIVQPEPHSNGGDLGIVLEPNISHKIDEQPSAKNIDSCFDKVK